MPIFSKPLTNSQVQTIVLGSVALVSVLGLVYYFSSGTKPVSKQQETAESSDEEEEEEVEEENEVEVEATVPAKMATAPAAAAPASAAPASAATATNVKKVEDVDGDDTDEEAVDDEAEAANKAEAAQLKEQYDQLVSVALKYAKGEKYRAAIDKYTEALALMPRLSKKYYPNATKDLASIYNNRSAMLEKSGSYAAALADVAEVLKADAKHSKARGRRARIYEATDRHRDALVEYGFQVAHLQQKTQQLSVKAHTATASEGASLSAQFESLQKEIAAGAAKMEEIAKVLAGQRSVAALEELKHSAKPRVLPCQSYCKNFLETFPSYYVWRCLHEHSSNADEIALNALEQDAADAKYDAEEQVRSAYKVVTRLLLDERYAKAFNLVARVLAAWERNTKVAMDNVAAVQSATAAYVYEFSVLVDLLGVAKHLKCSIMQAIKHYELARQLSAAAGESDSVSQAHYCEMQLKLASAYVEIGEHEKAEAAFKDIEDKIPTAASASGAADAAVPVIPPIDNEAWMLIHRAAFWVSRIRNASTPTADNVENVRRALSDLEQSFALTKKQQQAAKEAGQPKNSITTACHLLCLVKSIQINTHYSQQMGVGGEGEGSSTSFPELMNQLEEAKSLDAKHDAVVQLEMELLFYNGDYDAAVSKCDALIKQEEEKQTRMEADKATVAAGPSEDHDDCHNAIPFILKANFLSQKAFAMVQEGKNPSSVCAEMEKLFMRALELEPQSVDAMIQYANIKTLFGEPAVSAKYTDKALPFARNLQELLDILQLNEMTKAQTLVLEQIAGAQQ